MKHLYKIFLFGIFGLAFILRIYNLNAYPVGMTDDEIREVYSAYSLATTGRDLMHGRLLPFAFIVHNFSFSPVPIYIMAPFAGILGLSPFAARLPYAIAGLGVVIVVYFLALQIFKEKAIALLAAVFLACNVWAIHLSRMAYEALFAQFFYILGTYIFLSKWKKSIRTVAFSMLAFFLAFNSYDATKALLIPVLAVLITYKWREIRSNKRIIYLILVCTVVIFSIFGYLFITQKAGIRGSAAPLTIFQNTSQAAEAVELERRASTAPEILKVLYHNKATYFLKTFLTHYLYAYSFDFLFLSQEASGIFSIWSRGNLYYLELPFLVLGMYFLVRRHLRVFWLTIAMMLISAIPSGIGPQPYTYATRSVFLLPWLSLPVAVGVYYFVMLSKNKSRSLVTALIICIAYLYSVFGYLTQYYFEWPGFSAPYFSKDVDDVIRFINRPENNDKNVTVGNSYSMFLLRYAFVNGIHPRQIQELFRQQSEPTVFNNITVIPFCLATNEEDPRGYIQPNTIYISKSHCHKQEPDEIIYLPDNTAAWYIYNGV